MFYTRRLSWIEVNGTTYRREGIVILGMDLVPKFGLVEDIIVFHTDLYYLICEVPVTECFSHHFHAFQARKQHPLEYFICKQSHLYDHTVLAAYVISSQPCLYHIPLKYQLVEND